MTGRLILTRGLPGSGKTTRALAWVAQDPSSRARINRDDYRMMMHGQRWTGIEECEEMVNIVQMAAIFSLLGVGIDVVSDDTWLNDQRFNEIVQLAHHVDVETEVWDMTDVPPEVCIERDEARGNLVGRDVIMAMHQRMVSGASTVTSPLRPFGSDEPQVP